MLGFMLACVASVSVWFRSKERFSVLAARDMKRELKVNEGGGEGRGKGSNLMAHPLPTLLLEPFFARSLTLVPRSLRLNRTETLPTQARFMLITNSIDISLQSNGDVFSFFKTTKGYVYTIPDGHENHIGYSFCSHIRTVISAWFL